MKEKLLEINNLHVAVEEKEILKGLNLVVNKGEVHVIMGPNGAGKSTLVNAVMGHPKYTVTEGDIIFENELINDMKTNERAKRGLFLSFQYPEEVPGITVENFLRSAKVALTGQNIKLMAFKKELRERMEALEMNGEYSKRYLNVGFSGGEKKKNEILQMMLLNPKLAILDETDSGLDIDAVKIVSNGVRNFIKEDNGVLIITHNSKILEYVKPDFVHVVIDGKIAKSGDSSLIDEINSKGFGEVKAEFAY